MTEPDGMAAQPEEMSENPYSAPAPSPVAAEQARVLGIPGLTRARMARLLKFGVVGASGVLVNLLIFEIFYRAVLVGIDPSLRVVLANGAGLVVSIFTNFVLNDVWTWGDRSKGTRRHWFGRMAKYYVAASVAGAVQLAVSWLAFEFVFQHLGLEIQTAGVLPAELVGESGVFDLSPTLAVLTGIGCGMAINFLASHLWAFADVEADP